mmetsp:Transcript_41737/g.74948  ORF Transcript_41737/g.74948 Transcript_41737/m.74948 type:complete len:294 (+) Transcript_41737:1270-2151(+)
MGARKTCAPARLASMERLQSCRAASAPFTDSVILATASSFGSSSPSGVANDSISSMTTSRFLSFSSSLTKTSLALIICCPPWASRLDFPSSWKVAFKRIWSFDSSATSAGSFTSCCLFPSTVRAAWYACEASFSATADCSTADFTFSMVTSSTLSVFRSLTTSLNALTWFSASAARSTTSLSMAFILRSTVSFLKAFSFLSVSSQRDFSVVNSSWKRLLTSFENFPFMSPNIFIINCFAISSAEAHLLAAASHAATACKPSSVGRTSSPFRKGISASDVKRKASSACSIFSCV